MSNISANILRRICLLLCVGLCSGTVDAQKPLSPLVNLEKKLQEVIQSTSPCCVAVLVHDNQSLRATSVNDDPFDAIIGLDSTGALPSRFGAGVVVKAEGKDLFILTNTHLIEPVIARGNNGGSTSAVAKILIRTERRETLTAEIFAADPRSDLAVLKVTLTKPGTSDVLPLGQAATLQRGSFVVGIGNPHSLVRNGTHSATFAMIANTSSRPNWIAYSREDELVHSLGVLLELDARLPTRTSGGAIVNLNGELIGLTTGLATDGHFAIPLTTGIRRVVETLLSGYEVEYGFLGMSPGDSLPGELDGLRPSILQQSAARVSRMSMNSPAQRSGLKIGDVILSVGGVEVFNKDDLIREVSLLGPGASAELSVWRSSTRELDNKTVKLGKWPVYDDSLIVASNQRFQSWQGIKVDFSTARQRYLPNRFLTDYPAGVVVSLVEPNSVASTAGLQVGQFITKVNETPIETPTDFHTAVANLSETVKLTLWDETSIELNPK